MIGYLDQPYSFSEDGGVATVRVGVVNGVLRDDLVINIQSEDRPGIANPAFRKFFSNSFIINYI